MKKLICLLFVLPVLLNAQIKEYNVPYSEFEYNSAACGGYRYTTGTLIFIPDNAFVMEDGSACKGKIIVRYRELHTKMDMLVSGLNMFVLRNGKRKMLESVGMFEISASCNGKPMKLADGKFIQVRMVCRFNLQNLESFIYDYKQNLWLDAGLPVLDFSFKTADNNKDNTSVWGSTSVGATTAVINEEDMGSNVNWDSLRTVQMTNMLGPLPDEFIKGLNISKLGTYNYDAVIKDEKAVPLIPTFVLNTGKAVKYPVYVAYKDKNSLVYYYEDDFKERFVLLPEKDIRIFSLLEDGSVATLDKEFFSKMNIENLRNQNFTFTLEHKPGKPKDKPALAEATRLN